MNYVERKLRLRLVWLPQAASRSASPDAEAALAGELRRSQEFRRPPMLPLFNEGHEYAQIIQFEMDQSSWSSSEHAGARHKGSPCPLEACGAW
jgi:hypothetical protein